MSDRILPFLAYDPSKAKTRSEGCHRQLLALTFRGPKEKLYEISAVAIETPVGPIVGRWFKNEKARVSLLDNNEATVFLHLSSELKNLSNAQLVVYDKSGNEERKKLGNGAVINLPDGSRSSVFAVALPRSEIGATVQAGQWP